MSDYSRDFELRQGKPYDKWITMPRISNFIVDGPVTNESLDAIMVMISNFIVDGPVTNESLDAIMVGLQPRNNEQILAVCGAGCVPFALVSSGAYVDAVDIDAHMI